MNAESAILWTGLPVPRAAVPRLSFVSGSRDNNCPCIPDQVRPPALDTLHCAGQVEGDQVCPVQQAARPSLYPWRQVVAPHCTALHSPDRPVPGTLLTVCRTVWRVSGASWQCWNKSLPANIVFLLLLNF